MFRKGLIPIWVCILALGGMFLMGQETWPPQPDSKIVFLSESARHADGLGSLAGADAICQADADAEGLQGTYMAWLSDSTESPSTRFSHATVPYKLVDGTVVADDWIDLTDGTLSHGIDMKASGTTYVNPGPTGGVWTCTLADGTAATSGWCTASDFCDDWTSTSTGDRGIRGWANRTDSLWSYDTASYPWCPDGGYLFCFQQ